MAKMQVNMRMDEADKARWEALVASMRDRGQDVAPVIIGALEDALAGDVPESAEPHVAAIKAAWGAIEAEVDALSRVAETAKAEARAEFVAALEAANATSASLRDELKDAQEEYRVLEDLYHRAQDDNEKYANDVEVLEAGAKELDERIRLANETIAQLVAALGGTPETKAKAVSQAQGQMAAQGELFTAQAQGQRNPLADLGEE